MCRFELLVGGYWLLGHVAVCCSLFSFFSGWLSTDVRYASGWSRWSREARTQERAHRQKSPVQPTTNQPRSKVSGREQREGKRAITMTNRFLLAVAVLVSLIFVSSAYVFQGRARSHRGTKMTTNSNHAMKSRQIRTAQSRIALQQSNAASDASSQVSKVIQKLNSSTKWLITIGNTLGVWCRPHSFQGPYIIAGAIASVYFTDVLKKLINQGRPDGSILTDPGMPSSHSLVSFFAAIGWVGAISASELVGSVALIAKIGLIVAASAVAILRVVCGYHTWAQIGVGASVGAFLGQLWLALGAALHLKNPRVLYFVSWATYLAGSALFVNTNIKKWHREHKHH